MASNDKATLLERVRGEGFEVALDPPGGGMCFYAATGHQLGKSTDDVHNLIFDYLHQNRYEDNGEDRLSFLCSVDLSGKKVPSLWNEALDLLKVNYANSMVIRSVPEIFDQKVVIVTVHGSSPAEYVKEFVPKKGSYIGTLYFGHTGNHYIALKPSSSLSKTQTDVNHASLKSTPTLDHHSSEDLSFGSDQDSDEIIISPKKGNIKKEKPDKDRAAPKAFLTTLDQDSDCEIISPKNTGPMNKKVEECIDLKRIFCENVISHPIEITCSKKVKASTTESLLKSVCAVLNSGGGLVHMKITDFSPVSPPLKRLDEFWSGLEDKLIKMISPSTYGDVFDRELEDDEVFLFMRAPNHWCTIDYNLFVPLDAKTLPATYDKVLDLLSKNTSGKKKNSKNVSPQVPLEKLPVNKLPEEFHSGAMLKFHETKQLQFKHFPSHNGILHNNNSTQLESVQKYISAFGNGNGGMILLGVTDEGKVEGQNMGEDSKGETKKRVESIINDMSKSWFFTPERKIHWDIKFFPVVGKDSSFVIIIYIAGMQNLGGIFVKCPTSFELSTSPEHGEEEVIRPLDIQDWKKRMLCGAGNRSKGKKEVQERFQMLKTLKGPLLTLQGSVQEIRNAFFSVERGCPVTPEGFETNLPDGAKEVIKRIQQRCSNGRNGALLVASRSLSSCLGRGSKNDGVICDLLLFSREMKGLHLFTLSNSESEETFMTYAQTTARALKKALVIDGGCHEKFYITPHVVPCRAETVQVEAELTADSRYPMVYQLESSKKKLKKILNSLVIVLAQKPSMLSNKQGISFFNLLTKEQFQLLYQEIDKHRELWIKGAAGTGKTLVAVEFIRELRRRNPSLTNANILYVCENLGLSSQISKLNICECYCRKTFMKCPFPEVKHVILDEVQSFRQQDGDWFEKARHLVCQHCSDSGEDSGHSTLRDDSDSDSVASLDSDSEPDATFVSDSGQHTTADPNSDSSSDSDSVYDLGPASRSSRCYENDPGFLWLFIDSNQVNHRFRTGIPEPIAQNPSFTLTKIIRNSKNICNFAKKFLREDVAAQIEMGHDYEGEKRYVKKYPRGQQISALKKELEMLFEEGYSEGDIAILYGKAEAVPNIDPSQLGLSSWIEDAMGNDSRHVVLSTFRKYSGLERPVVILIDLRESLSAYSLRGASFYCAVTRAMIKVIVLEEEKEAKRGLKRKH